MKIAYRYGHMLNCDQGASGIINEYDFNRLYGAKVAEYLGYGGAELLNCTPTSATSMADSLSQGVNKANTWGADLFVSFHGNAYDGSAKGSEVVCGSQNGITVGTRVINNLANLGFTKRRSYIDERGLYEIRETSMVAIIVEPLFVDSRTDIDLFNRVGVDAFAKTIAEAILNKSISKPTPVVTPTPVATPQPVQMDSNVLALQKALNRLKFVGANGQTLSEDGQMGANTQYATKSFQTVAGLGADGVAGNQTWSAINTILAKPLCQNGSKGVAVRYIQSRVRAGIDGAFGLGTAGYVRNWQSANGLSADGVVGNGTWTKLIG